MDLNLEDIHITQYFFVLVKRVWLIILCFVLIFVFTIYLTYRQTPIYEAAASVYVSPESEKGRGGFDSMYQKKLALQDQVYIIKSDRIAAMVIDALQLEKRFTTRLSEDSATNTRDDLQQWVKDNLIVTPQDDSQILIIASRGADPQLVTDMVNTACDQFIIHTLDQQMQELRRRTQWYNEQIEDLRNKAIKSKLAMIEFIEENRITFFEHGQTNVVESGGRAVEGSLLSRLQSEKLELELARNELLQRYTSKHPKVQAIAAQINAIEQQIQSEYANLTERNKKLIELKIIEQDANSDEEMYNGMLKQVKEAESVSDIQQNANVFVLDYAKVPKEPISPNKVRNYLLGLLFGILGGIGMAFVVEFFDDAPKSASEIEAFVNLPIIATLPKLRRSKDRSIDLISAKHPKSTEAEVMRMLRTYILFEKENPEDKVILVTSSGPKEGKSSIASNLGVSMAQSNLRTLLIDADLRRPILHRLFNVEKEIGLSDLLMQRSTLDRVIKKTDIKNLYVMTCGSKVPNPTELLNSQLMKKTMLKLRSIFGQIVIDTPPTGNLADSLVIASLADSAIVIYSGELNKNLLLQTKRMLEKTNIKIYGIVLNNFNTSMKGYYYSYYNKYYNRYYQTYFHEETEDEQEVV